MTIAEHFRWQGYKEGFIKGFVESYMDARGQATRIEIARRLIADGFNHAMVKDYTSLSDDEINYLFSTGLTS